MRVLHYIGEFSLGGIEKGACVLAAAMAQMGHQAWVLARHGGPRFRGQVSPSLNHLIVEGSELQPLLQTIDQIRPDVVHIHRSGYMSSLVRGVAAARHRPLIVSTPVFGRAPDDADLLQDTRVCLVGTYTFYRFCKWTGTTAQQAIERGVGYVPITPYERPASPLSTLDPPGAVQERRREFGVTSDAFVVGRLARNHIAKWSFNNDRLVNTLLESHPSIVWLSIGFPDALGRERLRQRWGKRFVNLPETPDYQLITRVLSCLDVQMFFGQGECFASSIAEASGVGVPTIALATPLRDNGQAEQIIDDATGYLVGSVQQAIQRVTGLIQDPSKLRTMKRAAQEHCHAKWSAERAATDLSQLYEFWRNPSGESPPYTDLMLREVQAFARDYHNRIVRIMADGPVSQVQWNLLMKAVENPQLFKIGRAARRLRHWKTYRELPKE